MKNFLKNTIVQLLIAVALGIAVGVYVDGGVLAAIVRNPKGRYGF